MEHLTTIPRTAPAPAGGLSQFPRRLSGWMAQHPVPAVLLVSLLAVVINCYPIIFCGRSFVSPTCSGAIVYSWWPPLPGAPPGPPIGQHGSDSGAMMIWGVPAGFIASHSLLQDGELPWWDRYGHAGGTFIGQAVSMLGDPLQWIVILGRGAAGAWDLKFLAAKFLFCAGFGLLIFRLLGSPRLALIFAALAAWCGAFFYIDNHPVFFPFAYSPWILLSAVALLDPQSRRRTRWGLIWLLANVACFNGGHVEVAVVLMGGLNLAALAHAAMGCRRGAELAAVLGRLTVAGALLLGLTAPVWLSFLASLQGSYSVHSAVKVYQLQPQCLPGVFDDLFYHFLLPRDALAAIAPGASLLVLAGCLLSALRWRQLKGAPFFVINSVAILVWGGCVFGWVPALLLEAIPLLNRVGHNYIDFSYLLILHLTLQSAFGFKALAERRLPARRGLGVRQAVVDGLGLVAGFAGLMLVYCLANTHRPILWDYFLCAGAGAVGAPMLFAYLRSQRARISGLGWTGIILLGFLAQFRFGLYSAGNQDLLMIPGPREVLDAPSQAISWIKADQSGPFRVAGLESNLLGDYAAVYGLEDIRSCAPLSSGSFMDLVLRYPGITFSYGWTLTIADPATAQPLLNLLNVKYLLAPPAIGLQPGLDFRIPHRSDFGVVENLEAWPRAFFTGRVISIASTGEFVNQLWANGKQPFIALAPEEIERQPGLRSLITTTNAVMTTNAAVSAANHYRLRANSTAFDIHAASAGVVCLTENQARDFLATANGTPKPVLTVNRAFKGLYLDQPGDYHIEFTYCPRHWRLAWVLFWLAAAAAAALAGMGFMRARIQRRLTPLPR